MSLPKRILAVLSIAAVLTIVLTACTITNEASQPQGPSVHMGSTNFLVNTITIKKGQELTLINDASVQHIITNGTWAGTTQKPGKEPGAPTVNLTFNGQGSQRIGPFTSAGTFRLYCTIHQGMNLDITVQ